MSSIVLEVLATSAKMNAADLKEKTNKIQKEIQVLKHQVKEFIEDNYVDFLPTLKAYNSLVNQSTRLIGEMKALQSKIEEEIKVDLSGSTEELRNLSGALSESTTALNLSCQLLELNECFQRADTEKQNKEYIEAAKTFKRIEELLNDEKSGLQLLDLYPALGDKYYNSYASLLTRVSKLWDNYICWNTENKRKNSLMINCESSEMSDIVSALYHLNEFPLCLHYFSNRLVKDIIKPIIHSECSVYVDEERTFNVEIISDNVKNNYQIVLYNLKLLFKFINQHFNFQNEENLVINQLNENIWKDVADDLVNNCIAIIIPNSMNDLKNFNTVEKSINELEDYLMEIGFIVKTEELYLSNYIKNVDSLYVDKKCQDLLNKATAIMKKDLHDSFKYEPPQYPDVNLLAENVEPNLQSHLSKNSFDLPTCQISKSTKELMDLVRDSLDEAILSPDIPMAKLYYTTRNVFEAYMWIVPEYHKKFLETIPQQVALFHNNCMYLAHNLMTLGHEYKERFPKELEDHNIIYVDLTVKLRSIGVEHFLNHIKYQRNIILNILKESGLSQLSQELPASTERAFRQCIRQLELLKTVWLNVLPINNYTKTIGCILNSMIEDIVLKVTTVEDISVSAATDLANLFSMMVKRIPMIFPEPESINKSVNKWQKLLELMKILEAKLKDIEDRWAGGKGPLAREFTASQVKQLIRALFRNTERRSTLLANIK